MNLNDEKFATVRTPSAATPEMPKTRIERPIIVPTWVADKLPSDLAWSEIYVCPSCEALADSVRRNCEIRGLSVWSEALATRVDVVLNVLDTAETVRDDREFFVEFGLLELVSAANPVDTSSMDLKGVHPGILRATGSARFRRVDGMTGPAISLASAAATLLASSLAQMAVAGIAVSTGVVMTPADGPVKPKANPTASGNIPPQFKPILDLIQKRFGLEGVSVQIIGG
jgi:hypothetical protein